MSDADTMGSSMVSSTRLGYSHTSYQQMSYYLGDIVLEDGKDPLNSQLFHQMRRTPRANAPSLNLHR